MKWFEGDVTQAIAQSRSDKVVFLVYIEGEDEDSRKMKNVWDSKEVSDLCCRKNCVGIKINSQSEQFQQFAHFYPVVCIPSTYFIGDNGIPLEIVGGTLSVDDFIQKIRGALQDSGVDDNSSVTSTSATQSINERIQRAQDLIEKKRLEKEQEQKEKAKSQEMIRRKLGQDMARAKQEKEEKKMKEHAAKLREEKLKEKAAREAVKQAIARDRAEKESERQRERAQKENEYIAEQITQKTVNTEASSSTGVTQNSNTQSSRTRIQFRLPDGSCLVNTFSGDDLMEVARQFVVEKIGSGNITMCTTYPRRQLLEEDYQKTLQELGLTPSSTIIVAPATQLSLSGGGSGGSGVIGDVLSYLVLPFLSIWNVLKSFLFGTPSEPRGSYSPSTSTIPESAASEPSSNLRRRTVNEPRAKREGNIHRLRSDDDDENNTWNGNSTQQM